MLIGIKCLKIQWFTSADGFILLFNVTSKESVDEVQQWHHQLNLGNLYLENCCLDISQTYSSQNISCNSR
jgi:hypothetical protein